MQIFTCALQDIVCKLDIRLFLRVSHKTLKHRRDNRYGYHTAGTNASYLCSSIHSLTAHIRTHPTSIRLTVLFQPEGSFWQDPPGYWNDVVWPAYLKAHSKMFQNNDVEHGTPLIPPLLPIRKDIVEHTGLNPVVNGVDIGEMDEEIVNGKDEQTCGAPVDRLNVFNAENMGMEGLFIAACERILRGNLASGFRQASCANTSPSLIV